jgi:hypothetical protein
MSRVKAVDSCPRRLLTSSIASPSSRSPITADVCRRSWKRMRFTLPAMTCFLKRLVIQRGSCDVPFS